MMRTKWLILRAMWRHRHRIILAAVDASGTHGDRRRAAQLEMHRVLRESGLR